MIMVGTSAHRAFAVVTFFLKIGESVIAMQKAFLDHYMLHRKDAVRNSLFNT